MEHRDTRLGWVEVLVGFEHLAREDQIRVIAAAVGGALAKARGWKRGIVWVMWFGAGAEVGAHVSHALVR
jgi:hypothetical protein